MRALLVALAATVASTVVMPPAANGASTYHVYWCKTPDGRNVADQVKFGWNVSYVAADSTCGTPNGRILLSLGGDARPTGAYARGVISLYNGLSLSHIDITRTGAVRSGNTTDTSATPTVDLWSGGALLDRCALAYGCSVLGLGAAAQVGYDVSGRDLHWEVACGGSDGGNCASGGASRAEVTITAVHLAISDSDGPSVDGTKAGTALAGGVHRGQQEVSLPYVSDYASGIYDAQAYLGGKSAGSVTGLSASCVDRGLVSGSRSFDAITPCPTYLNNLDVPVNTKVAPDGSQHLEVWLSDAAGNRTRVVNTDIDVDNIAPPVATSPPTLAGATLPNALRPGDTITAANGTWSDGGIGPAFSYRWQRWDTANGWTDITGATGPSYVVQKADVDKKLRVVVTAKNSEGAVDSASEATGVVQSGATVSVSSLAPGSTQAESSASPQLVLDREQRSVSVKYGAKIVVTGRLVDSESRPIADADVDVFEQVSVVGAAWKKLATIKTDSQGGYVYRPTTTGSRVLRFAYSAARDTGEYRATREVVIAVTAGMDLRALKRTVPANGVIRLHGRVVAEPLPKAGTWVEVQVLDAGVWRTIGTRKTSPTGRWSFKHRLRRTAHVTFAFRARLRQLGDVPAVESKSTPVKVRVR